MKVLNISQLHSVPPSFGELLGNRIEPSNVSKIDLQSSLSHIFNYPKFSDVLIRNNIGKAIERVECAVQMENVLIISCNARKCKLEVFFCKLRS